MRVNIPFIYKQYYHNLLSRFSSLFIYKITKKRKIRSTPEFIDAPPKGERSELKLLGVMFSASNEEPKSLQLNLMLLAFSAWYRESTEIIMSRPVHCF